jgi:hypothetical protein
VQRELLVPELDAGELVGRSGCGTDIDIAMSR